MIAAPAGFVLERLPGGLRVTHRDWAASLSAAGLQSPWQVTKPRPAGPGTGRGPRAHVELTDGRAVFVKQYLRGGALARLNRERYFGLQRFQREIEAGQALCRAGLGVGELVGLVLRAAHPGWRAWGIARGIADAPDLAAWMTSGADAERLAAVYECALALVSRALDAGLVHPDLNLGNLLVRVQDGAAPEAFLVDLDRARWIARPVDRAARWRAFARLERSWQKILGPRGPVPPERRAALSAR